MLLRALHTNRNNRIEHFLQRLHYMQAAAADFGWGRRQEAVEITRNNSVVYTTAFSMVMNVHVDCNRHINFSEQATHIIVSLLYLPLRCAIHSITLYYRR
jgi:hypothetical protein